jgi:hypothetical protein
LDSFQNLLFSIARFHEYTGYYPVEITVVGYEFKRRRFVDLHRAALRWQILRFHYIGIDPDDERNLTAQDEVSCGRYMSCSFKTSSARIWLSPFFQGLVWVSLYTPRKETTEKSIHPVSFVLHVISQAAVII